MRKMMNQICSDCHQKAKFCHGSLFGPYANAFVTYHMQFMPVKFMANHEEAKKMFRKAYNCALKFYSFRMTLECFTDQLELHEDWILRGMDTLDKLYPTELSWKAEEFVIVKMEFTNYHPSSLPKDICLHWRYSTKNKECHVQVFHAYCKERVNKVFSKFAKAMHPMMIKKVYCIIYNGALHFYNYCRFEIMTRMTFVVLPPECLLEELKQYMDDLAHKRSDYMECFHEEDLHEWKDTDLIKLYLSEDH